jgi:hypothetical protein
MLGENPGERQKLPRKKDEKADGGMLDGGRLDEERSREGDRGRGFTVRETKMRGVVGE